MKKDYNANGNDLSNIYIFPQNDPSKGDIFGVAVAEDGDVLASHLSSSIGFMRHDMGLQSTWKHDKYRTKYPKGYNLIELKHDDPFIDELAAKYKALEARND